MLTMVPRNSSSSKRDCGPKKMNKYSIFGVIVLLYSYWVADQGLLCNSYHKQFPRTRLPHILRLYNKLPYTQTG